jgi:CRISPR-associated endonuclease/helicase Cas3
MRDEDDLAAAEEVDLRLWGKSRGLGEGKRYPLVCHLLDAGAAARCLWGRYVPAGVREFIADGFGVTVDHAGRLIALWAALHDVGKLIAEFQALDPVGLPGYPASRGLQPDHDVAGHHWLQATLPKLGYAAGDTDMPGFLVPQLLGGHHGTFHRGPLSKSGADGRFRDDAWERQRQTTLRVVSRILGSPGPPPKASPQAAVLVCAIVILADWLVSQDGHLLSRMPGIPVHRGDAELRAHFEESLLVSANLANKAGLAQLRLRPGDFGMAFPQIKKPNELQQSVASRLPDLAHGPGLLLVMAPPGLGKTETAWYAAKVMGEAAGRPGLYMALPTTATADQIYLRIRDYVKTQAETPAGLMLLHGMAWLNTHYRPDAESTEILTECGYGADSFSPADWLLGRNRGMCGAWAVGTIDQALMAVLKTRFNALRLFGLAGKTVIVDEVHACDPFMQGLLLRLLRWLGSFGTPVVLLSATLTNRAAAALVSAYLAGAGIRRPRDSPERVMAAPYPVWHYADGVTGAIETVAVPLPPALPLQVSIREVSASAGLGEGRPVPDRGPMLRAELAALTESGGCALVICTTVNEAQRTYCQLQDWFSELSAAGVPAPELGLLHARFPAWQRDQITQRVMAGFGKDGMAARPRAAVLVATAIVEQSLDLDFDLIVSDLAPIALLLQRAGRCWRHEKHGIRRPSWASGPHLTVLVPPGGPHSPELFESWAAVYDESLLANTYRLLDGRTEISIPDDVQELVDAVYCDERFTAGDLSKAALARIGSEIALAQLADNITIPGPSAVDSLYELTEAAVNPDLLVTRFGADSVLGLPVFTAGDGHLWLDRASKLPVPGQATVPDREGCRTIINHTVPVRSGSWLRGYDARSALPESWRRNVHLRDIVLLPQTRAPDGSFMPATVGDREFFLDDVLGLRVSRAT